MAPEVTGNGDPAGTRRKLRGLIQVETLPLAVALQGLALFVLAFLLSPASSSENGAGPGAWLDNQPVRTAMDARMPVDLLPERIRLPRFPGPDGPKAKQPASALPREKQASGRGLNLAALRVESVALDAPAAAGVALAIPGAPDRIRPGTVSLARFGEGGSGPGRRGREGGWGGFGGGVGIAGRTGGVCGRADPRPPRPPHIIDSRFGLPPY